MKTSKQLLNGEVLDLRDEIAIVSPVETPLISLLMSNDKTEPATSTKVEWREESLDENRSNPAVEGSKKGNLIVSDRKSKSNNCQIIKRDTGISGTVKSLNPKGVGDELTRQIDHRTKEIKNDMEYYVINGALANEEGATGRQMNGVLNLINDEHTITITKPEELTYSKIEEIFKKMWDRGASGGRLLALCNSDMKTRLNDLLKAEGKLGLNQGKDNVLGVTCRQIITDYGDADILLNRYVPAGALLIVNFDHLVLKELRTTRAEDLGKAGDSEEVQVIWEGSIELSNQYAGGKIITVSDPQTKQASQEQPKEEKEEAQQS